MRKYKVEILGSAEDALLHLYETIAIQVGTAVAGDYVDRIQAACLALETSPMRGTRRDDILPGLRTVGFERRAPSSFVSAALAYASCVSSTVDKTSNVR